MTTGHTESGSAENVCISCGWPLQACDCCLCGEPACNCDACLREAREFWPNDSDGVHVETSGALCPHGNVESECAGCDGR